MNSASRTQRLFAASLILFGLAASVSQAQTVNVNGATCAGATVTFGNGSININTGGCGTTVIITPPSLPLPSQPPSISSMSVSSGTPNAPLTIFGTNLAGATVMIGGVMANAGNNSGTQIITNVPSNANPGVGTVAVTTSIGTSSAPFIVNVAPPPAVPSISSLTPNAGTVGTVVTITGTGLAGATVTIGGVAATITTSSATSITTSVPAGVPPSAASVVVTTSVGASSSTFTVTPAVAGSESSIEGHVLPTPSKFGFVVPPIRQGANGAGSDINAYAMSPSRCSTTPALTRSWQHNIDLSDYKGKNAFDYFVMGANEALSYKFTVPTADTSGGFIYNDGANAVVRPTFISITSAPCDFNITKIENATRDACYQTGINGNGLNWVNITGPIPAAYCRLVKGQTYYMNIRFQDARPFSQGGTPTSDSCMGGNCGGILQVL